MSSHAEVWDERVVLVSSTVWGQDVQVLGWYGSLSLSESLRVVVLGCCCEILVGISCRVVKREELLLSLLQLVAFDTINSVTVLESLWVLVVCMRHHWEMVVAIKMFMVIMTFDGVLWGIPIAAVLVDNFL